MHWARVIREADNPEWTVVVHKDGSLTEVKVGVMNDEVHVAITGTPQAKVYVTGEAATVHA